MIKHHPFNFRQCLQFNFVLQVTGRSRKTVERAIYGQFPFRKVLFTNFIFVSDVNENLYYNRSTFVKPCITFDGSRTTLATCVLRTRFSSTPVVRSLACVLRPAVCVVRWCFIVIHGLTNVLRFRFIIYQNSLAPR